MPNLIFLDMETTDIENPRIVQLAYSTDTYDFESKYKPPVPISIEAMSVHHITNRMVEDCTAFEISAHESDLLDPDTVVVAHNAKFDIGVLKNEGLSKTPRFIDTLRIARHLYDVPRYNLQYLRYWMGLEIKADAHDALGDVTVLKQVFLRMLDDITNDPKHNGDDYGLISEMEILSVTPVLLKSISFGGYAGKTFEEIASFDKPYLQWLLGAKTKDGAKDEDEDIIHTLKYFLSK